MACGKRRRQVADFRTACPRLGKTDEVRKLSSNWRNQTNLWRKSPSNDASQAVIRHQGVKKDVLRAFFGHFTHHLDSKL
jgi:hypothetical protein